MIELEARGIATVACTARGFVEDARTSAATFGLHELPLAVFPHPFTNQPPERIRAMIDDGLEQIVAGLTQPPPRPAEIPGPAAAEADVLTFEGDDLLDCFDRMNRGFLERGWGDGFPLVPPTEDRVERMLRGVRSPRDRQVAVLEPGFGMATIEKIAINAVMAGCRPEHLPIIVTAVQCLAEPRMILRMMVISTGPPAPSVLW